jgi:hypothetical protein
MTVALYLEKPIDPMETVRLAEVTDLLYRRLLNLGYAHRHAEALLPDKHTALQAAAVKIIKRTPDGKPLNIYDPNHPANYVSNGNLAVLKPVTMSLQRAICLGTEGRIYTAFRGRKYEDRKFEPTALHLTTNFMLVAAKMGGRKLKRLAILKPTQEYMN